MKRAVLCTALAHLLFLVLCLPTQAQVSFLQPPVYAGSGNLYVADFNGDGKRDVLTADGTMNLGNGDGTFTAGTKLTVPSGLSVLAVADFNGDLKPDVLEQGTGTLLVLLGNGDGTFQTTPISTPSAANLTLVAAVDLNGDGKADVLGVFNGALYVYLNTGNGKFASPVTYNLGSIPAGALSFGDFNGDHKVDVVVSTGDGSGTTPGQEIVLLGKGDGTFQGPKTSVGVSGPLSGPIGDFNGDGKLDIAINNCDLIYGCLVYVLLGNGDGTFQAPTPITKGTPPLEGTGPLAAGDFNGDGKDDLFYQGDSSRTSVGQIYLSNGDGTFLNTSNYVLGFLGASSSTGIAVADFNGDGKKDVAVGGVSLLGNGNGTFQGIQLSVVPNSWSAGDEVIGDFDKNGTADMAVVSSQSVYILRNNGTDALSLIHTYTLHQSSYAIVTADFNGDGNLDLVVFGTDSTTGDWNYSVLLGNGDGSFQSPAFNAQSVQTNAQSYSVVVADFNNDRKLDIGVTSGNQTLALLLGNGDGSFAAPSYLFDAGASSLLSADFNGDGKVDIAGSVGPQSPSTTAILFGNGDGTFRAAVLPSTLKNFAAQFTVDLNNDGKADLVSSSISSSQVALGNGDGTFTLLPPIPNQVNAIADFNGDGKPDLVVTQYYRAFANQSGVMLGMGDGTFGPLVNVPTTGFLPSAVLVADMNGDGRPDIVFPWGTTASEIGVLLNTTPNVAPDFSITSVAGSSTSQTVSDGTPAKFNLLVTPTATFSGVVNVSCTITPAVTPAATCGLSSGTLQITNGTAQPVTVNVTTVAPITSGVPHIVFPAGAMPLVWMLMLLGSACLCVRTRKRLPALAATIMVLSFMFSAGCGSG